MSRLKSAIHQFFILSSFGFCLIIGNEFSNQQFNYELYQVEVGITSITKSDNDEYIISVYAINPYKPIAGIQFKIQPSDLFNVLEVYGGRTEEEDFEIHFNKKGTVLGFSMVANTIDISNVVSGPNKLESNLLLNIRAKANKLDSYNLDSLIDFDCVFASKKGEVLETKFIPFKLSDIQ